MPQALTSALQPVKQNTFVRGLNTTTGIYNQPKGSLPRLTGMVLSKHGALMGASSSGFGAALNQRGDFLDYGELVIGGVVRKLSLQNSNGIGGNNDHLPQPPQPSLVGINTAGGLLVPGQTYVYQVTAVDGNSSRETTPCAQTSLVLPAGMNAINIVLAASNAVGYNIYGRQLPTLGRIAFNVPSQITTDLGTINPAQGVPSTNTTQTTVFMNLSSGSLLNIFPPDVEHAPSDQTGFTFLGGGNISHPDGSPPLSVGMVSYLAQIVPFSTKVVLALGNNHPIYTWDGIAGAAIPLVNNFSATIPDWAAARTVAVGDILLPTANNAGAFIFEAVQGGVTGAVVPSAFPQMQGQQVADGAVIWQNTGQVNTNPAPRGAAHLFSFAGSLVAANTAPLDSPDGLDGPNVLAFSDFNNLNSWNPRNRVVVAKNDGQQIMGLGTFAVADTGILPTGGLVIFRERSMFILFGFPPNEQVVQVQTDKGCVAPRSIVFIPGMGLLRLSHLGWALFDGIQDKLVSPAIDTMITGPTAPEDSDLFFIDPTLVWSAKAALCTLPLMYLCAINARQVGGASASLPCNKLVGFDGSGWTFFDTVQLTGYTFTVFKTPVVQGAAGSATDTVTGSTGIWASNHPTSVGPGLGFITLLGQALGSTWSLQTPEVFAGGHTRVYFRRLTIRGLLSSANVVNGISATIVVDGVALPAVTLNLVAPAGLYLLDVTQAAPFAFEAIVDIGTVGFSAHALLSASGDPAGHELTEFDWDIKPISAGVPVRLY